MTRLMLVPAMLLAEGIAAQTPESALLRYGIPGIMIAVIVVLWREDRNARIQAQTTTSTQYVELVQKLLATVEANTAAMQGLRDGLAGKVSACPFDGESLRDIMHQLKEMDEYQHKFRHEVIDIASGKAMIARAEEFGG